MGIKGRFNADSLHGEYDQAARHEDGSDTNTCGVESKISRVVWMGSKVLHEASQAFGIGSMHRRVDLYVEKSERKMGREKFSQHRPGFGPVHHATRIGWHEGIAFANAGQRRALRVSRHYLSSGLPVG